MTNPEHIIAFQGVAGAHSDVACKKAFPYKTTLACNYFEDVFDAVVHDKATIGLIPIENSHAGRVAEIHNLLPDSNLSIVGEYFHKVQHHLLAPKGADLASIKTVYSHSQALMQCAKSVRKLGLNAEPCSDTAGAAKMVAQSGDLTQGALASRLAAELYDLQIIEENMQDSDDNTTLFVAIAKEPIDPPSDGSVRVLTSLLFTTRNIAAGLYKTLGGFATNNVNILKLESYIPNYASGTAQFFITFEGHPSNKNTQQALEELGFFTSDVQLLGIYEADPQRYK